MLAGAGFYYLIVIRADVMWRALGFSLVGLGCCFSVMLAFRSVEAKKMGVYMDISTVRLLCYLIDCGLGWRLMLL